MARTQLSQGVSQTTLVRPEHTGDNFTLVDPSLGAMPMNKGDRKRLRRMGRELVQENSRKIQQTIKVENPAPFGFTEWIRKEISLRRASATQRAHRQRGSLFAPSSELPACRLPDRAFQLARRGGPFFPAPANARKQMALEFPEISPDPYASAFFQAYDQALELLAEAERVAQRIRDAEITEVEAKRQLQERFAGYAAETYDAALGEGLFRTR